MLKNDLHKTLDTPGAAAAKAIGGNTLAGGSASANGTKWNWLGKEQYTFVDELLSLGEEDEDRRIDIIARYAALSNFKAQHGLTGDGDDERITASLYPILRDLIPERYRDEWLSKGLNYTLNAIVCMDERTYKKANEYRTLIETGKLTIEDYLSSSKAQYILDGVMAKQKADTVFNTNSSNGISEYRECIIVCVKAKFVDTLRARSGHPIGGFIPTWQNAK